MPFRDKAKRRAWEREYRRKKRAGALNEAGEGPRKKLSTPPEIRTADDVRAVLAEQVARVQASKADPVVVARVVGYLAGVLLRAIEVGDLEQRFARLEQIAIHREAGTRG